MKIFTWYLRTPRWTKLISRYLTNLDAVSRYNYLFSHLILILICAFFSQAYDGNSENSGNDDHLHRRWSYSTTYWKAGAWSQGIKFNYVGCFKPFSMAPLGSTATLMTNNGTAWTADTCSDKCSNLYPDYKFYSTKSVKLIPIRSPPKYFLLFLKLVRLRVFAPNSYQQVPLLSTT